MCSCSKSETEVKDDILQCFKEMRGQFEAVKQVDSATLDGLEMRVITLLKVMKQNSKSNEFAR